MIYSPFPDSSRFDILYLNGTSVSARESRQDYSSAASLVLDARRPLLLKAIGDEENCMLSVIYDIVIRLVIFSGTYRLTALEWNGTGAFAERTFSGSVAARGMTGRD
jgi:hypothetical protein